MTALDNRDKIVIRNFTPADRRQIRRISCDSAFMGEPVERFLKDRELFADWATLYYTDYEPESVFLAEYGNRVAGYIMGCCNEENYRRVFSGQIQAPCLKKAWKSLFVEPSARVLLFNLGRSFLCGEFRRPDFSNIYPAHLHINVDAGFRCAGIGAMLMDKFLSYLVCRRVMSVRLATISKRANRFFRNQGFGLLYRRRVTYFDYLAQEEIYLSMYGKMLE